METSRIDFRERLIQEYTPLVRFIAQKIAARLPSSVELDDLISAGHIGLMDATKRFDPKRKNLFKTYAEWRIRGSILDELRNQDWIPRSVRDKQKVLEKTISHLTSATNEEAAAALNISLDEYYKLVNLVKPRTVISIDEEREGDMSLAEMLPSKSNEIGDWEAKRDLDRTMIGLNQRQKIMTKLHYVWGLHLIEIAELFEITESRVSQLIKQAEQRLKNKLGNGGGSTPPLPPLSLRLPDHDFEEGA